MSEPTLAAGAAADTSSQPVGGGQEPGVSTPDTSQSGDGLNPAWNSVLGKIPPEFHKLIEPDLRQWDKNFTTKTQEVQSRYEPYNFLLENNIEPEQINTALQMLAMIETDPRAFHTQMGEFYKDQWVQGQEVSPQGDGSEAEFSLDGGDEQQFDVTQHPKFKEMAANQEALATWAAQQIERENESKAEAEITAEESRLKDKYGEYDEKFVFSYAIQNEVDLEDAVKAYKDLENKIRTTPRANDTAPPVFAPSGGVPSSQPKPGQLSDRETKNLVAEMAARAHSQG